MSKSRANILLGIAGIAGFSAVVLNNHLPSEVACNSETAQKLLYQIVTEKTELGMTAMLLGALGQQEPGRSTRLEITGTQTLDTSTATTARCRANIEMPGIRGTITRTVLYSVQKTDDNRIAVNAWVQ